MPVPIQEPQPFIAYHLLQSTWENGDVSPTWCLPSALPCPARSKSAADLVNPFSKGARGCTGKRWVNHFRSTPREQVVLFRHFGILQCLYVFSVYTDQEKNAVAKDRAASMAGGRAARSPDQVRR